MGKVHIQYKGQDQIINQIQNLEDYHNGITLLNDQEQVTPKQKDQHYMYELYVHTPHIL